MTSIAEFAKKHLPAALHNVPIENELGSGIEASMPVISIRGKVWRIKHRGDEIPLMRADGDGPRSSIDVVIIKAAATKSKIYYPGGYVEGSSEKPACWSSNALAPDSNVPEKQAPSCVACPHNVFGSKITPAGKPAKACTDSKRLAVVFEHDLANEQFGGPMLLRVPPASLNDLTTYGDKLAKHGIHSFAVATRISFDPEEAYPKFVFDPLRVLDDAEIQAILEYRNNDPAVARILNEGSEFAAPAEEAKAEELQFVQPNQTVSSAAKVTSPGNEAATPAAKKAAKATEKAVQAVSPPPPPPAPVVDEAAVAAQEKAAKEAAKAVRLAAAKKAAEEAAEAARKAALAAALEEDEEEDEAEDAEYNEVPAGGAAVIDDIDAQLKALM